MSAVPKGYIRWGILFLTTRRQSGGRRAGRAYCAQRGISRRDGGSASAPRNPGAGAVQKSRDLGGLKIGQLVRHAKFGDGVIVAAEGSGQDAKLQINFGSAGVKWLLLSLAKLEAV